MARDAILHDFVEEKQQIYMHFFHSANIIWHKYLNFFFMERMDTFNQAIQ